MKNCCFTNFACKLINICVLNCIILVVWLSHCFLTSYINRTTGGRAVFRTSVKPSVNNVTEDVIQKLSYFKYLVFEQKFDCINIHCYLSDFVVTFLESHCRGWSLFLLFCAALVCWIFCCCFISSMELDFTFEDKRSK